MNERQYWDAYIAKRGNDLNAVAEQLKTPYSTIAAITNGTRGIGRQLAARFAECDPELDATKLVWVTATDKSDVLGKERAP